MKNFSLVVLFLYLCLCNLVLAFFSSKELKIFGVFVKPYGISFKDDYILKVSRKFETCTAFNDTFKDCNSTVVNLTSSTHENVLSKFESLSKSCPRGSYSCFCNTVNSAGFTLLKGWFIKVQSTVENLCKGKCWQTLEKLLDKCIQAGQSGITESEKTYVQFMIEILKSLCIEENNLSCANKFINGLQTNCSSKEVCSVTKDPNTCSSQCYVDVKEFFNNQGCCIGSVSRIMECYSIQPQSGSYGVFVKDSYRRCHLKRPEACAQDTTIPCTPPSQRSPTPTSSASSSKGKQIAGICLAVIICVAGAVIVGNYFYQRMKRRAKIRFEDYGYSRLKMLEDEFYFDVEIEDDENEGLVQL